MIMLDTSFLVDYLSGKEECLDILDEIDQPLFASSITMFELYRGALRSQHTSDNLKAVENELGWLEVVELGREEAREAAEIEDELRDKGKNINLADALIAGAARRSNGKIITCDQDFDKIRDLETVNHRKD